MEAVARGGQPPAFAIIHTWPKIKNAEYEIIQRVVQAANNLGILVYVVDDNGYILQSNAPKNKNKNSRINSQTCQFLLSLHFESPRVLDIFSYAALWNPLNYYSMFGYHSSTEKLASHNDVLSCRSDTADAHAASLFEGMGREIGLPPPAFFHTVPGPFLEPRVSKDSRLFYIGINWERISGKKGRHHDLLKRLDDEGLIQIYGPEIFQGVEPWKDFQCYNGSIPFDGHSVIKRINEAGICLVLSSESHQRSGIMSSRLFEGLAAGAAIICNSHPLVDKFFADCVYVLDDSSGPKEFSDRVREIVLDIRKNPSVALERAHRAQKRFQSEGFSLERCLGTLFQSHSSRKEHFDKTVLGAQSQVSVLLNYRGFDFTILSEMIANVTRQRQVVADLVILINSSLIEKYRDQIEAVCKAAPIRQVIFLTETNCDRGSKGGRATAVSPIFAKGLKSISTDYFCTMQADDYWFEDHLASLANSLRKNTNSFFACSGRITESIGLDRKLGRTFEELTLLNFVGLINVSHPRDVGRFLYRSELLRALPKSIDELLPVIDGQEHRLLNLWASMKGCPVQTNYATYVHLDQRNTDVHRAFIEIDTQIEMIRDTVRGNSDWLMRLSDAQQLEKTIAGLRVWPKTRFDRFPKIEKDRMYVVQQARLTGFLPFDGEASWIEGLLGIIQFEIDVDKEMEEAWLVLTLAGRTLTKDDAPQKCTITINGFDIASEVVGERLQQRYFRIPMNCLDGTGLMRVEIKPTHAEPILDKANKIVDPRLLGLRLHSFGIWSKRPSLRLTRNRIYDFVRDAEEIRPAIQGFYDLEPGGPWIEGKSACIQLELKATEQRTWLTFVAAARKSNEDGSSQICTVSFNDIKIAELQVAERFRPYKIEIPREANATFVRLGLELKHAGPVLDQTGKKIDKRELGMRVMSFGIVTDRVGRLLKPDDYGSLNRFRVVRVFRRSVHSVRVKVVRPWLRRLRRVFK